MTEKNVGDGRLRVVMLPNGQFLLVLDKLGWTDYADADLAKDAASGVRMVAERVGAACVGVWRFAGELDIPDTP